ncbi:MAG: hypothetical protein WBB01_18035 [Phormidesmis sp.]
MIPTSRSITRNAPLGSAIPASTQAADAYSDHLMDDLFLDVDRILDGDLSSAITVVEQPRLLSSCTHTIQLPPNFVPQSAADIYRATVAASYRQAASGGSGRPVTAMPATPAQLDASAGAPAATESGKPSEAELFSPRSGQASLASIQSVSNYLYPNETRPDTALARVSPQAELAAVKAQRQVSLPFLLMGAASIAAIGMLGLWTIGQSMTHGGGLLSLNGQASAAALPSSNQAFLNYLQHSLEVISAREAQTNGATAALPALPTVATPNSAALAPPGALPSLPTAPTDTNTNAKAPNIIERVFVPVYQNSQNTQTGSPLPTVVTPRGQRPTVSVPAPAAAVPARAPVPSASIPVLSGNGSLPSLPVAVAPTNSAPAALTDVTPKADLALVGILNLGSRSAALFNIDGSSQRAYVGDRVGVSGWTLVSINAQDVVVRRDGEVRSIYIGQTF